MHRTIVLPRARPPLLDWKGIASDRQAAYDLRSLIDPRHCLRAFAEQPRRAVYDCSRRRSACLWDARRAARRGPKRRRTGIL